MHTTKNSDGQISIQDLTAEEAGLIQVALLRLAEATTIKTSRQAEYVKTLRRIGMQIDKLLT